MDNGLDGRYPDQLQQWNQSRKLAANLIAAFYNGSLKTTIENTDTEVEFPPFGDLKSLLMEVIYMDGNDSVDKVAKSIIEWRPPESTQAQTQPVVLSVEPIFELKHH